MNIRCACIRGNFNYYVKALDKHTLIYQDLSDWMEEDRYYVPEIYRVTVIPPGSVTGIKLDLSTKNVNRLTEEQLGCIEDGIWCFETESCGVNYKRSVGIFYKIECCLRKAFAKIENCAIPVGAYEKLKEVEMYLELCKSAAEINNYSESNEFLEIAQKKLDRIKCNCKC